MRKSFESLTLASEVLLIPGVGTVRQSKLIEQGAQTVADVVRLDDDSLRGILPRKVIESLRSMFSSKKKGKKSKKKKPSVGKKKKPSVDKKKKPSVDKKKKPSEDDQVSSEWGQFPLTLAYMQEYTRQYWELGSRVQGRNRWSNEIRDFSMTLWEVLDVQEYVILGRKLLPRDQQVPVEMIWDVPEIERLGAMKKSKTELLSKAIELSMVRLRELWDWRETMMGRLKLLCPDVDAATQEPHDMLNVIVLSSGCYKPESLYGILKMPRSRLNINPFKNDGSPLWEDWEGMMKDLSRHLEDEEYEEIRYILTSASRENLVQALGEKKLGEIKRIVEVLSSRGEAFNQAMVDHKWPQAWKDRWKEEAKSGFNENSWELPIAIARAGEGDTQAQQMRESINDFIKPVALSNLVSIFGALDASARQAIEDVSPNLLNMVEECAKGHYCVMLVGIRLRDFYQVLSRPALA